MHVHTSFLLREKGANDPFSPYTTPNHHLWWICRVFHQPVRVFSGPQTRVLAVLLAVERKRHLVFEQNKRDAAGWLSFAAVHLGRMPINKLYPRCSVLEDLGACRYTGPDAAKLSRRTSSGHWINLRLSWVRDEGLLQMRQWWRTSVLSLSLLYP